MTSKALETNNKEVIKDGGGTTNKIVINLIKTNKLKNNKFKNSTFIPNIGTMQKPIFLISMKLFK